jgi:hypothetical protein
MLQSEETSSFVLETSRRRSTFYVPLTLDKNANDTPSVEPPMQHENGNKKSIERIYNPDLSACSFDWSLNDSINSSEHLVSCEKENRFKRYGIVLNGSVNIDDSSLLEEQCQQHQQKQSNTSTPIRLMKSRSRNNILTIVDHQKTPAILSTPVKEKSKTLPQNMTTANTFPPKSSFILKSTPKISLNYSSSDPTSPPSAASPSPKKSLSFIRRTHSTKLSRSNSLLKSLTSKCVDQSAENLCRVPVAELKLEHLEKFIQAENCDEQVKEYFFKDTTVKEDDKDDDESGVHSGKQNNYQFAIIDS